MISLIVWLILLLVVLIVLKYVIDELPLPPKVKNVVLLLIGLLFILILISRVGLLM